MKVPQNSVILGLLPAVLASPLEARQEPDAHDSSSGWSWGYGPPDWNGGNNGGSSGQSGQGAANLGYKHVAVFSVDGLHASDIPKWLAYKPDSNISALLNTGYLYPNANTSAPSDSYPGTVAQYTGGSPKTTGVWYDVIFDRSVYPPGSDCTGESGYEGKLDAGQSLIQWTNICSR